MKKNVTLSSCYNFESGYGVVLNEILNNFQNENILIYPRSFTPISPVFSSFFENRKFQKSDIDICLLPLCNSFDTTHPIFHLGPNGNRHLFTMWESSCINDMIIEQFNKMKGLIVPNEWNIKNFKNQGCEIPIFKLPLFVNTNEFFYKSPPDLNNFIFTTGNDDPRKRLNETIRCFLKAFPKEKDVKLKVKTKNKSLKFFDSRIDINNSNLYSMNEWYWNSHVFVSGASAEGWGLMQHESMACGRPIISVRYAGVAEFLNFDNGYCLDYDEIESTGYWACAGGKWSKFKEEHMIETMRYCYNNREETVKKGLLAADKAKEFSSDLFIQNLRQYVMLFS